MSRHAPCGRTERATKFMCHVGVLTAAPGLNFGSIGWKAPTWTRMGEGGGGFCWPLSIGRIYTEVTHPWRTSVSHAAGEIILQLTQPSYNDWPECVENSCRPCRVLALL